MKVIRAVISILVILGLTYLVFHISKLYDNIVNLEEEVEVQEVFIEQLEEDKKELTVEKNVLEVDMDALELDKQSLEKEVDKLHRKYEDCKRSKESIQTTRGSSRGRLLGTFEATAYDLSFESCGKHPDHPAYGITASGTKARLGVVAVDPKVIPLGTKLYVEGYGNAIAEDVGGAIKGRLLDVFFNTKNECIQWGRKQVNVWIVD